MSRSGKWYPIRTDNISNMLTDILSKFRSELELAIKPIEERLDELESRTGQGVTTTTRRGLTEEDLPLPMEEMEVGMSWTEIKQQQQGWREAYIDLMALRRAMFGYTMLAASMGLDKNMRQQLRQIENMISAAVRLMQTIRVLQAMEAGTMGWWGLPLTGGMLAATFVYSAKATGGG